MVHLPQCPSDETANAAALQFYLINLPIDFHQLDIKATIDLGFFGSFDQARWLIWRLVPLNSSFHNYTAPFVCCGTRRMSQAEALTSQQVRVLSDLKLLVHTVNEMYDSLSGILFTVNLILSLTGMII